MCACPHPAPCCLSECCCSSHLCSLSPPHSSPPLLQPGLCCVRFPSRISEWSEGLSPPDLVLSDHGSLSTSLSSCNAPTSPCRRSSAMTFKSGLPDIPQKCPRRLALFSLLDLHKRPPRRVYIYSDSRNSSLTGKKKVVVRKDIFQIFIF